MQVLPLGGNYWAWIVKEIYPIFELESYIIFNIGYKGPKSNNRPVAWSLSSEISFQGSEGIEEDTCQFHSNGMDLAEHLMYECEVFAWQMFNEFGRISVGSEDFRDQELYKYPV